MINHKLDLIDPNAKHKSLRKATHDPVTKEITEDIQ